MHTKVTALLVSHDGERWLPAVISGLQEQHSPVERVVAIDTGSKDDSAQLLEAAFGEVLRAPGSTSFPQAVRLGIEHLAASGVAVEQEVVWPRGGRSLYFRDPAGNAVELVTPGVWGTPAGW